MTGECVQDGVPELRPSVARPCLIARCGEIHFRARSIFDKIALKNKLELARDDCRRVGKASRSCKLSPLSSASTCCLLHVMLLQLLQPCIISPPAVHLVRLTAEQLLESDPQRGARLAYGLFRIFAARPA